MGGAAPQPPTPAVAPRTERTVQVEGGLKHTSYLNRTFTFDNFVEGKSNQLARAAAWQVADNPKHGYNPLFLYGGVGLGKTHLMHAVGNHLLAKNPNAKVVYLHSERFVADMVKALQLNAINEFKRFYRSVDALLIDDIQFFAKKERSQEEFFHTFNALHEAHRQIVMTCDRPANEIQNLENRLVSRFEWGLVTDLQPPDIEMRLAILQKKARVMGVELPSDVMNFLAHRIRTNIRRLEGALIRVASYASLTGKKLTVEVVEGLLREVLHEEGRFSINIEVIQPLIEANARLARSDQRSPRRSTPRCRSKADACPGQPTIIPGCCSTMPGDGPNPGPISPTAKETGAPSPSARSRPGQPGRRKSTCRATTSR